MICSQLVSNLAKNMNSKIGVCTLELVSYPWVARRSSIRGLVLSEIVLSLGLLAVVGLTVIGVFSYLAVNSQGSSDRAAAELLSDSVLERAVKAGPDPDAVDGLQWGVGRDKVFQELSTADNGSATRFTYQVSPELIRSAPLGSVYLVTVEVAWAEEGGVERGKGHLKKSRTVYIEDDGKFVE
jgi:hypothetical protein